MDNLNDSCPVLLITTVAYFDKTIYNMSYESDNKFGRGV